MNIGRSELIDWWCLVVRCVRFVCAMDNLCHVSTSRETSRRHVRVRSCPANFEFRGLARAVGAFLKMGPLLCAASVLELSQWARGGLSMIAVCKFALFGQLSESLSCLSEAAMLLMSQRSLIDSRHEKCPS